MMSDDLTVQILVDIRDEIRNTNKRLDQTRSELSSRIDAVRNELGSRIDAVRSEFGATLLEAEVRISTRIVEQTAATRDLYAMLNSQLDLRDRVERCEADIAALKARND